ncbi:MAG: hypothetical protein RBT11_11935 [Desulfobacterales bacterium]|jgi:hypothetical protein|nr:hypothetical protein [Desulfobacterales bacterium]
MIKCLCRHIVVIIIFLFSMSFFAFDANAVDYQILFRPDASGVVGCYEFAVAEVGGPLLTSVNVLSSEGMRQNWGIDIVGGRGPWENGVWKNRQFALARVNQLSPLGDDWYGCKTGTPLIQQPPFSIGWPSTPIQYPVQDLWQILFKPNGMGPNCFEFNLAVVGGDRVASPGILTPLARRENWGIDDSGGRGVGPEGTWFIFSAASSRMNDLSSYGRDAYGCRGVAQMQPPAFSVGWPPPPDQENPKALWQILRKPNGMGPNCFEFYLTNVGGNRVSSPGVLTPLAIREGWQIDNAGGAGSGPAGTWINRSAASSQMNKLSTYGGDLYGCRRQTTPPPPPPPPPPPLQPTDLTGGLDPHARQALISVNRSFQVTFESSNAEVRIDTDGLAVLRSPIRCTITATDNRPSGDQAWFRYTYTVILTPNGRSRGIVKAFRQVDYVFESLNRKGQKTRRNHVGKPIPVQGPLRLEGRIWRLSIPNGNGSSIGSVPYLLE